MKKTTLTVFVMLSAVLGAAAVAGTSPPVGLPEPGTLGLLGMGIAGIVLAARMRRRK